jgi:hypothetical protein
MALTKQDLEVVASLCTAIMNERPAPIDMTAHVVPGTYRQLDGTVEVLIDDTDAAFVLAQALGDPSGNLPIAQTRVPIATHDPNDQYGPRGGESTLLGHAQHGHVAAFIADADTEVAPGAGPFYSVRAPAGERWIMHRNVSGNIDSAVKLTNDGPTPDDGLGGTIVGNNGALTQAQTASGHTVALNDTARRSRFRRLALGMNPLTQVFDDPNETVKTAVATAIYSLLDAINEKDRSLGGYAGLDHADQHEHRQFTVSLDRMHPVATAIFGFRSPLLYPV